MDEILENRRIQREEDIKDCIIYWCWVLLFLGFIGLLATLISYIKNNG